ncbi:hypothetical protein ABH922_001270 [Rhodococcus sp. 27YEA15]
MTRGNLVRISCGPFGLLSVDVIRQTKSAPDGALTPFSGTSDTRNRSPREAYQVRIRVLGNFLAGANKTNSDRRTTARSILDGRIEPAITRFAVSTRGDCPARASVRSRSGPVRGAEVRGIRASTTSMTYVRVGLVPGAVMRNFPVGSASIGTSERVRKSCSATSTSAALARWSRLKARIEVSGKAIPMTSPSTHSIPAPIV